MREKLKMILRFSMRYALIVVPLFLLSLYASRQLLNDLSAKEAEQARMRLQTVADALDDTYAAYQAQGTEIADKPVLRSNNMLASYAKAEDGIKEMQKIRLLDRLTCSLFMEYETGEIYSVEGYSHADIYFSMQLNCTPNGMERAMDILSSMENQAVWLEANGQNGYLLLHYPAMRHGKYREDSINFLIAKEQFFSFFPRFLNGERVYFHLEFSGGQSIYFSVQENRYVLISGEEYAAQTQDHLILQERADDMQVSLEMKYPQQALLSKVNQHRLINMLILALGLLLSMLISLQLGRRQLGKIQQLERIARGSYPMEGEKMDEYGLLRELIGQNLKETEESRNSARTYQTALRQQLAAMIFDGQLFSPGDFQKLSSICGIEMMEEYFCVMGVQLKEMGVPSAETVCGGSDLFRIRQQENQFYVIWLEELPNPDFDKRGRMERWNHARERMEKAGIKHGNMTVSQVYQDIRRAQYAYQEVLELLRMEEKTGRFLCWNEQEKEPQDYLALEKERLSQFSQVLSRHHEDQSLALLKGILRSMHQENCSEETRHYICYSIVWELIQVLTEQDAPGKGQWMDRLVQLDIRNEENFTSVVQGAIRKICSYTANSDSFIQQVCDYIQANYGDSNLSAELVAQHIGINKSYLSRLFKAKMEMSYIDYLTRVRMEKARELLAETDLPIKEIVSRVGYIDDSSFRKKFKAIYGVRLSDYRKSSRNSEEE